MKNKKKILTATGLAAVILIGGVFAYFNQTMTVENPFDTGSYDSVLTEDFSPGDGDNWEPGSEVNKDVEVKNTGDYDLIVRVKLDEKWARKDVPFKTLTGLGKSTSQESDSDGLTANDGSVVTKTLIDNGWVYDQDGYWYYKTNLTAGSSTGKFLDSVTLLENADMGKYSVTNYYTLATTKPSEDKIGTTAADAETMWVAYTGAMPDKAQHTMAVTVLDQNAQGYAEADYTLTITAQTVQATKDAVKSVFGKTTPPTGCTWTLK